MPLSLQSFVIGQHAAPSSLAPQTPYFFSLAERQETLAGVFNHAYSLFIEINDRRSLQSAVHYLLGSRADFALSLTTESAYRCNVPITLTEALNERFCMQDAKTMQVETCLQEAIVNAVVHGNLNIKSGFESLAEFDAHYELINARLSMENYRARRIHICVWNRNSQLHVAVTDEGSGILSSSSKQEKKLPHGNGLFLIRSLADKVWVGEMPQTLNMIFSY